MNAHTKFDVNLKTIVERIVKNNGFQYSVSDAEELAASVPPIKRNLFNAPFTHTGNLFTREHTASATETGGWIVEHHNLVPHATRAGFIQITPAGDLDKAHKIYGFGYQVLGGGRTAFSPLFAIQIGTNWFPGLQFFSRTSLPERLRFPDRPISDGDRFSRALAAS